MKEGFLYDRKLTLYSLAIGIVKGYNTLDKFTKEDVIVGYSFINFHCFVYRTFNDSSFQTV